MWSRCRRCIYVEFVESYESNFPCSNKLCTVQTNNLLDGVVGKRLVPEILLGICQSIVAFAKWHTIFSFFWDLDVEQKNSKNKRKSVWKESFFVCCCCAVPPLLLQLLLLFLDPLCAKQPSVCCGWFYRNTGSYFIFRIFPMTWNPTHHCTYTVSKRGS